jgi:acetyl-CoA acetyltransferase
MVAIVGAAETEEIGTVAKSSLGLAADAARRALADCGLSAADVDGVAMSGLNPYLPILLASSLGIEARWVDATMVGGCSNVVHLRHAVAAIRTGQCEVVLIAHGESGRSHIGGALFRPAPDSWQGQFEGSTGVRSPRSSSHNAAGQSAIPGRCARARSPCPRYSMHHWSPTPSHARCAA